MAVTHPDADWSFDRATFRAAREAAGDPWQEGLDECRRQGLKILAAIELIAAWLLFVPYVVEATPRGFGWVVVALVVASVGGLMGLARRYEAGAFWMVAFLAAAATLAAWTVGSALAVWSFALVVGVAAALVGLRWAAAAAGLATVVLGRQLWVADPALASAAWSGLVLAWATLLVSWLGLRPLQQALGWAIASQQDARARALEAERHRGELGLVTKTLRETHERLRRATVELERAREAADEARALKAKFAAYISHELRTPLNLIIGFSEMMVLAPQTYGGEVLPPSYRGDVDAIYNSARHLSALIDDVLDLSQIDAHRMALDRDDVAVADVIEQAVRTVSAAYEEQGLRLRVEVADGLPTLYADATRLRQVLINLLGNALRYTERGGVTVRAANAGKEIVVSVADTGAGIPPEELPHLFQEFRQAERPPDQASEGSGLGLAIAKRFVGLHGGWMKAESAVGEGSTFSFGLPIPRQLHSPSSLHDSASSFGPRSRTSLPTVAVVDADPFLMRALHRYLDGYRIAPLDAGVGGEALLDRRHANTAALIVPAPTDADGWMKLQQISATSLGVPIVACALRGGREALQHFGVADYVDKPVTRERLAEALAHARPGRGTRSILVVDDDPHMVRLLERMISATSRRFKVAKAYDGGTALELMRRRPPDLVLLDLIMPGVDGYGVLQRMRDDAPLRETPVVVVTARGLDDDAVVAGMFGLARSGGFPAGELVRCLQATLDNLNPSVVVPPPTAHEAAPPA